MAVQSTLRRHRTPLLVLLATVLLARSRRLTAPRNALVRLSTKSTGRRHPATDEELEQAQQEVYRQTLDGSRTLLVPSRGRISEVRIAPVSESTLAKSARAFPPLPPLAKPALDARFLRPAARVDMDYDPPYAFARDAAHPLYALSIAVARFDCGVVRDRVSANGPGFLMGLGLWFALAILGSTSI